REMRERLQGWSQLAGLIVVIWVAAYVAEQTPLLRQLDGWLGPSRTTWVAALIGLAVAGGVLLVAAWVDYGLWTAGCAEGAEPTESTGAGVFRGKRLSRGEVEALMA